MTYLLKIRCGFEFVFDTHARTHAQNPLLGLRQYWSLAWNKVYNMGVSVDRSSGLTH